MEAKLNKRDTNEGTNKCEQAEEKAIERAT